MPITTSFILSAWIFFTSFGCHEGRTDVFSSGLTFDRYDFTNAQVEAKPLPGELREISGLSHSPEGHLFAHNDEQGIIYQINPSNGEILKRIVFGGGLFKDFEGIAIADGRFFIVVSDGTLYEFETGTTDDRFDIKADVKKYETPLTRSNDIEGLCYDPTTHALLLACKEDPGKGYGKSRAVYAFPLRDMKLESEPRFLIDLNELKETFKLRSFKPSGIEYHPKSGTFFVLSSNEPSLIEMSAEGTILGVVQFPPSVHEQPEGIAIGPAFDVTIANEGWLRGTITRYAYKDTTDTQK
jgi:uncharacterized protein YjiK